MKLKKSVRHNLAYAGVLTLLAFFRVIPRNVGIFVARTLAMVYYAVAKKQRKNTIRHLTMAFGEEKSEKEIRRIARDVFLHFAAAGVDGARIPIYIRDGIDRYITTKNLHFLEKAHNEEKGFLLLTGHFGNWELMGAWVAQKKFQLHVVGAAMSNQKLSEKIVDLRNRAGYINIERGSATRGIIKALKDGFPVAMLIDQDTRAKGVFVDFFGIKAHTPIGPAVLAKMMDVPIIPMAMHLKEDLTYEIECFEPICYIDTGDKEKDIIALTQKCSDVYEQMIRQHPEQWVWMHRRWKKQPGDVLKKKLCLSSQHPHHPDDVQRSGSIGFQSR
jgi:KDO2-lipid IV(A) lauroyltransferase